MVKLVPGSKKKSYKSIKEAAEALNLPYMTLYMRLRAGKPINKALKDPIRKYEKRYVIAA